MTDPSFAEISKLQENPSAEGWHAELLRIYNGDREGAIIQLGSAAEYVERVLMYSKDKPVAVAAFHAGFERALGTWHPATDLQTAGALLWLQLIRRHTPVVGLSRVIELAQILLASQLVDAVNLRLFRTVLGALELYYPTTPADSRQNGSYLSYVKLLHSSLDLDATRGHATRRLVELNEFTAGHDRLMNVLHKDPAVLQDVLSSYIGPLRRTEPLRDVQTLYGACVQLSIDPEFENAARSCSATISRHQNGVTLITADGKPIELVSDVQRDLWTIQSFNRQNLIGFKRFGPSVSLLRVSK